MKMYLIAIVVAVLGLWASNAAHAKDFCGMRSATVFGVKSWEAKLQGGNVDYRVTLTSTQDKAIKGVDGTVEFIGKGMQPVARIGIKFGADVAAKGEAVLVFSEPATETNKRLVARTKNDLHVLACIGSVEFADGSGMIVN